MSITAVTPFDSVGRRKRIFMSMSVYFEQVIDGCSSSEVCGPSCRDPVTGRCGGRKAEEVRSIDTATLTPESARW